jgi:hypothetical protein
MKRHYRAIVVASAVMVLLPLLDPNANAGTRTAVRTTPRNEFYGTGNAGYFAWTQDQRHNRGARDAWAKPNGQPAMQLDAGSNNLSWTGQMDQATATVAWQTDHRGNSNIKLSDVSTDPPTAVPLPAGVNTDRWEWGPAIFGTELTFIRNHRDAMTLYLVDLVGGTKQVVAAVNPHRQRFLQPPHIYGNWIVWSTYNPSTFHRFNAYEYDISNGPTARIPHSSGKLDYAPSVDLAGNVYFARSGTGCGTHVHLMEWTGTGRGSSFYAVDPTHDIGDTSVFDDGAGNVTVYASFGDCSTRLFTSDIYSFLNPTASPAIRGRTPGRAVGAARVSKRVDPTGAAGAFGS